MAIHSKEEEEKEPPLLLHNTTHTGIHTLTVTNWPWRRRRFYRDRHLCAALSRDNRQCCSPAETQKGQVKILSSYEEGENSVRRVRNNNSSIRRGVKTRVANRIDLFRGGRGKSPKLASYRRLMMSLPQRSSLLVQLRGDEVLAGPVLDLFAFVVLVVPGIHLVPGEARLGEGAVPVVDPLLEDTELWKKERKKMMTVRIMGWGER